MRCLAQRRPIVMGAGAAVGEIALNAQTSDATPPSSTSSSSADSLVFDPDGCTTTTDTDGNDCTVVTW
ncbi:hypothetical protein [Streptomyces sp. HUAS ZL42]|uniref:hypothetical protein n=1 Tax=Streptomyces sp. HUAS ZL42 TaxID=3231715 RepID=UPI00345EE9FE